MKYVIKYFLRGLLFVVPLAATVYILVSSIIWLDHLIPLKFPKAAKFPGAGILIILGGVTLIGYLGSTLIARPIVRLAGEIIRKTPLVSIIYTSLRDLISAFVGDKKKFSQPVLVTLNKESCVRKLGFITQKNLDELGITESVAVYLPHSYNFSGDLYIVPKESVTLIDASGASIMKFIVSGGVTHV
jgi:uncharacterized membrane protein